MAVQLTAIRVSDLAHPQDSFRVPSCVLPRICVCSKIRVMKRTGVQTLSNKVFGKMTGRVTRGDCDVDRLNGGMSLRALLWGREII
jgi:hypothetical protein